MQNIFVELLPPWVETGLQPAFYDKESGTVLQQVARMYAKVNYLVEMFNQFSKDTTDYVNEFVDDTNTEIQRFEHDTTETVNDYIARFVALKDYVDDYFDNLDVQEEINNKLDDMVEQGTLQEIITTYIQTNVKWTFDNVASMKLATNFVNGSFATTLGFYSRNDEGGATYKIRTKTVDDTADEMTLIALSDPTLIAELIKTNVMNVKQFGAKGDGITDDTTFIQTALNNSVNVTIPSGTYMIDAATTLLPNNNNRIVMDNDATLKAIPNNLETYRIIHIVNRNNIEISGGTIEGERSNHDGETGEWGVGIRIAGTSNNIYIHDINIKNTWGDGITVVTTGNVKTEHVHIDNARRNGYSIVAANEFISNDDYIENTNGTNPQAGVDIEPDAASENLHTIVFNNLVTKNNSGAGINIFLLPYDGTSDPTNITINNHYDYGSRLGCQMGKSANSKGLITYNTPYLEESGDSAIRLWRCYDSDLAIKIIRPFILNCDTNNQGTQYGAGISGYILSTETDLPLGNIEIIEPYITSAYASANTAISFRSYVSNTQLHANNIKIIDPIYLNNDKVYIGVNTNTYFSDKYNVTGFSTISNYTIDLSEYHCIYTNRAEVAASRTLTIPDAMWIGRKLKFRNMCTGHSLNVKLPTTDYCYQLSNTVSPTATLAKLGDTIELEKITSTEWIISDINCTPTVN